ncbi:hypothetical protein DV515_00013262 [Chloebia gouldiae]|uniref:Uncharacterized protein n=1 Tax=Chloebia gouldiae TaxID=44316 RepID=A0A3L8S1U1_CHLGU|nr:hypothetical protein DV515_00013262 [Chloebia gouldiae]
MCGASKKSWHPGFGDIQMSEMSRAGHSIHVPSLLLPVNPISMTHVPQPYQHRRCPSACKGGTCSCWLLVPESPGKD